MAEEMMIESDLLESDDASDWESDDAIAEAEDSAEDIGERVRRRRSSRRLLRPSSRGIRGIVMRDANGLHKVAFPTPVATNRGLAITRQALDERLDRIEQRFRAQQRNDSTASGLVSLAIGGGLAAYGAVQVTDNSRFSVKAWAENPFTRMATVSSVTQIAMSGAKFMTTGQYHHRSGVGLAADIFAVAQLAMVAYGSFYTPQSEHRAKDINMANTLVKNLTIVRGATVYVETGQEKGWHRVVRFSGEDENTLTPLG